MSAIKTCNQKNMYHLLGLVLVLIGIYFYVVVTYFEMNVNSISPIKFIYYPQFLQKKNLPRNCFSSLESIKPKKEEMVYCIFSHILKNEKCQKPKKVHEL